MTPALQTTESIFCDAARDDRNTLSVLRMNPHPPDHQQRTFPASPRYARNTALYYSPTDVSSRFGVRLRELRRERKLTQLQMAVNCGIDRSFISDVERGRKSISLPFLEIIALGLNVSMSDLFKNL